MEVSGNSEITGLITVPVYNEAGSLSAVIADLKKMMADMPGIDLLFINDGSTDRSLEILQAAGVVTVTHPVNLGYKEALRTGMVRALDGNFSFIVFFDADGQHRTEDLKSVIASYNANRDDLVIGSRYQGQESGRISFRMLGTSLFSWLTSRLSGKTVTDVTCGLKLISREYLPTALNLPAEDFHAELIVGLARCGATIREVPIVVPPRKSGSSMYSFLSSVMYPVRTLVCLLGGPFKTDRLRTDREE